MLEDFKKFIFKGNVVDLAIGVIIGAAFTGLVNSIVNDLIMPVLGLITGGMDFSNKFIQLSGSKQTTLAAAKAAGATVAYGHFITLLINFIIVAWVLFLVIKLVNAARHLSAEEREKEQATTSKQEQLLIDIRDALIKNQKD